MSGGASADQLNHKISDLILKWGKLDCAQKYDASLQAVASSSEWASWAKLAPAVKAIGEEMTEEKRAEVAVAMNREKTYESCTVEDFQANSEQLAHLVTLFGAGGRKNPQSCKKWHQVCEAWTELQKNMKETPPTIGGKGRLAEMQVLEQELKRKSAALTHVKTSIVDAKNEDGDETWKVKYNDFKTAAKERVDRYIEDDVRPQMQQLTSMLIEEFNQMHIDLQRAAGGEKNGKVWHDSFQKKRLHKEILEHYEEFCGPMGPNPSLGAGPGMGCPYPRLTKIKTMGY